MFKTILLKKNNGFIRTLTLILFCVIGLKKLYINIFSKILKFKNVSKGKIKAKPMLVCGFTLIEMLVVVAIIIVMTSVLLLKQSKFSSDILVTNAAYEVALSIREAQVYGISSKEGAVSGSTDVGYGVYLSNTPKPPQTAVNSFTIYSDAGLNPGATLNSYPFNYPTVNGATNEFTDVEYPALTDGQTILNFCVDGVCSKTGTLTSMNIGFIKPNPEALIYANGGSVPASNAAIIVVASSLGDKCRVVRITPIGQISVDTPKNDNSDCSVTQ